MPVAQSDYEREVLAWRAQRLERLTAEDGWLSLVDLHWLEPGFSAFGRDGRNRIVVDCAALPEQVGTFEVTEREVRFVAAPGVEVLHNGQPVQSIGLLLDDTEDATTLRCGRVSFQLIERDGQRGVRVRDNQTEARARFTGLDYFPIDSRWRLAASVEPHAPGAVITVGTALGTHRKMASPGALRFELDDQPCRLDAVQIGQREWLMMFADETNGARTYRAGRFLHVAAPIDGRTVIDFNKSYSPPCAFTAFATCPLPPPQNRLAFAVTAGELGCLVADH